MRAGVKTCQGVKKTRLVERHWKVPAVEGESPVRENRSSPVHDHPSIIGHVEPGVNQGGPPPKAKYSMATNSERSRATEK